MNAIVAIYTETHDLTKVTGTPLHLITFGETNCYSHMQGNGIHGQVTPYMPQQQHTSMPVLMNRLSRVQQLGDHSNKGTSGDP